MATKRKVLLMGRSGAGKTSIRCVMFANLIAEDTKKISPTIEVEHSHVRFFGNLILNLWDCGGQGAFMQSYVAHQKDNIFKSVDVLIYIFNVESQEFDKDLQNYEECLSYLRHYSSEAQVFCLLHKMDLISLTEQEQLFEERKAGILESSGPLKGGCFPTSIWDESMFKAWSHIVHQLIPNIVRIETNLTKFADLLEADEVLLLEKSTLLVICSCHRKKHPDPQRFEKISNILKQFRINCNKMMASFNSIEVRNSKFSAYIESFTSNTYIMVVTSDPEIAPHMTILNIRNGRKCFEELERVNSRSLLLGTLAVNH